MSEPTRHWPELLDGGWRHLPYERFRHGVDVAWLHRANPPVDALEVAVLRYSPGASVPRHRHSGTETILVLEGTQSDERGDYSAGSWVLNPVGSEHSVRSELRCVVLIQWTGPVQFID